MKGNCWPELLDFFITLGEADRIEKPDTFARILPSCTREFSIVADLLFRSAPIRVREKRMNTHKTAKTLESYQKVSK
jgi:hypothetical protein